MARNRFEQFKTDVDLANNDWRIAVGNPYVTAYTQAYHKYKETLNRQKEADKEAGELFVTAACVVTGSVLLGAIGSVTMRMIAKRTVVLIANATLSRNFAQLLRVTRKNEGVAFAVGKFVDGATGKLKENANKVVAGYMQSVDGAITPEPLVQFLQMDTFMRANVNCAIRMARLIEEDASLSEAQKDDYYRTLRSAPFLRKPTRRNPPYKASLAELIELTFYLSAMLETDTLETWQGHSTLSKPGVSIGQRPRANDYPKSTVGNRTGAPQQWVAVKRAGGDVQERTNELTKKIFNTTIYSSSMFGLGGPPDTEKSKELRVADYMLSKLATDMKPLNVTEAIS